jgi:hypothetical protein
MNTKQPYVFIRKVLEILYRILKIIHVIVKILGF